MGSDADATESGRRAAALNHLLGQIGLTAPEQTRWWNHVSHEELGGRTATQAWLAGDIDAVTALVEEWYAASDRAAREAGSNSDRLDHLRGQLSRLDERTAHRRLPTG